MQWTAPLAAIVEASLENADGRPRALRSRRCAGPSLSPRRPTWRSMPPPLAISSGSPSAATRDAQLVAQAVAAMSAQEIRSQVRFAAMLVPGRWASDKPMATGGAGAWKGRRVRCQSPPVVARALAGSRERAGRHRPWTDPAGLLVSRRTEEAISMAKHFRVVAVASLALSAGCSSFGVTTTETPALAPFSAAATGREVCVVRSGELPRRSLQRWSTTTPSSSAPRKTVPTSAIWRSPASTRSCRTGRTATRTAVLSAQAGQQYYLKQAWLFPGSGGMPFRWIDESTAQSEIRDDGTRCSRKSLGTRRSLTRDPSLPRPRLGRATRNIGRAAVLPIGSTRRDDSTCSKA